jgi:hypothetical protein
MPAMSNERKKAEAEFWRIMRWIAGISVIMAAGAIA